MPWGTINVVEVLDDRVLIHSDWLDGERVIYTDGRSPAAEEVPALNGHSLGRWEGDTLVVKTVNFHPDAAMRFGLRNRFYISADAKVEERFTRVAADAIFYEFSVDDPKIYSKPWRAEMVLRATDGPIYEYACHEANYSMIGILAGARKKEGKTVGTQ